jgi:hypothetical protein
MLNEDVRLTYYLNTDCFVKRISYIRKMKLKVQYTAFAISGLRVTIISLHKLVLRLASY